MEGSYRRLMVVLAALLLTLCACGGSSPSRKYAQMPTPFLNEGQVRGLLAQYSPRGSHIVTKAESLPQEFVLPEGPYRVSSDMTFREFIQDRTAPMLVAGINTVVHEFTHKYCSNVGFEELAKRQLSYGHGACAIFVDGPPILVRHTATFPAQVMAQSYPQDARTMRFFVYVISEPNLATQTYGVYGLLDEYAASLQGDRIFVDFWPWVRDRAPRDSRIADNYAVGLDDVLAAYQAYKLMILHYLLHAQQTNLAIYNGIMLNASFREAYRRVESSYASLAAQIRALEPQVHRWAASLGVKIQRQRALISIDGHWMSPKEAHPREQVARHLSRPQYQQIHYQLTVAPLPSNWF